MSKLTAKFVYSEGMVLVEITDHEGSLVRNYGTIYEEAVYRTSSATQPYTPLRVSEMSEEEVKYQLNGWLNHYVVTELKESDPPITDVEVTMDV